MNALAFVQAGDVVTTSGPITHNFPGGFVTQDQLVLRCVPLNTPPTVKTCPVYEIDPIVRRSGCVNSFATDAICAGFVNGAVRAAEYQWVRNASPRARKRICLLNYLVAAGYMAWIRPNNFRVDYALARAYPPPRNFRYAFFKLRL
ncbi:MAG: hypothetical protein M3N13_08945 [Candidatus Eremiobacteraeota bacterium]|nr:hypothetical protein [Candidatus Eremiobacteraeota bacterium]